MDVVCVGYKQTEEYSCVLSVEVNDGNFRRNQQISVAVEHINTHGF